MSTLPDSWSTQQLGEFLAFVSSFSGEHDALERAVERGAEVLDAEVGALIADGEVLAAVGVGPGEDHSRALAEASVRNAGSLELDGIGTFATVSVRLEPELPHRFLIARSASAGFDEDEMDLIRGMARTLAVGMRTAELLDAERSMREESDRQSAENTLLLGALRKRQGLLERLSKLQRAIVDRTALHEVLDLVAKGVAEALDADVVAIRLRAPEEGATLRMAASVGATQELLGRWREARAVDLFSRDAIERGAIVQGDTGDEGVAEAEFAAEGVRAALSAPLNERGRIAGVISVGTRSSKRRFGSRDEDTLRAFAEHAGLALNDARSAEETMYEAFHDSLTGLPNRALFIDRLEHALARLAREGGPAAVLFCDLDGFKTVNDSLGHAAGDKLLREVGARLSRSLRPADTVARFGGDEFAVLLEELPHSGDAAHAAERILSELKLPFDIAGREVRVGASIGIAAAATGDDADAILRNADLAMYRAKARGRARYEIFEPEMHSEVVERMELESDLKRAIANDELILHYQPIFDLPSRQIAGLEALVRWNHPERGLIMPSEFIPIAEESGEVRALGRFVLREATRRLALWRAKYPAYDWLYVSVNVSGIQLREASLPGEVQDALDDAQLEPANLLLEMTETVVMGESDASMARLEALRELGVRLAVDDFGTGYSSLEYLDRLPIDALKIAKPFVDGLGRHSGSDAIPRAIAELAEIFGLSVIAEGIEDTSQAEALIGLGCRFGQGNALSLPLEPHQADAALFGAGLLGGEGAGEAQAGETAATEREPEPRA